MSIGVVTLKTTGMKADEAINRADNIMYKVKKSGKNNILFEEISEN